MDEYENSGITSHKDAKRFTLRQDPSTVTVMDSANIGGGVETGSTGERDMHSDATSEKHATPPADSDVAKQQEDSSRSPSSGSGRESALSRPDDDVGDGHSHGGSSGAESTPSSQQQQQQEESTSGHASDFHSAEGLASDMPDRKGIHHPDSSGDRATDITGIPYIQ